MFRMPCPRATVCKTFNQSGLPARRFRNFKFERRFHNIKIAADIGFAAIRRKSKAAFVAVGA